MTLTVIGNGGVLHIQHQVLFLDDYQASIIGRHIVRIGHNAHIGIDAGFGIGIHIVEHDLHIGRNIVQELNQAVNRFFAHAVFRQLFSVLIQLPGKVSLRQAVGVGMGMILIQICIQPCGNIHIQHTGHILDAQAGHIAVKVHGAGNNGHICTGALNGNTVSLAVIFKCAAGDRNAGLRRLDNQGLHIGTHGNDLTRCIPLDVNGADHISTGMGRCFFVVIGFRVGANAGIPDSQELIADLKCGAGIAHSHIQGLRRAVKGDLIGVCFVSNLHIHSIGDNNKCTDNGYCVIELIAKLCHKGKLGVSAGSQLTGLQRTALRNQRSDQFAVGIHAKEQILNQCSSIVV